MDTQSAPPRLRTGWNVPGTFPRLSRPRIGWNVPGTFTRLGLHIGFLIAWLNARLPLPSLLVATSAGAIFAACCISFDRNVVRRVARIIRDLKREQIFVPSRGLIKTGVFLLVAGSTLIITAASAGNLGLWALPVLVLSGCCGYARLRWSHAQFGALLVLLLAIVAVAVYKTPLGWPAGILFCISLFCTDLFVRRALYSFFHECKSPLDTTPLRKLLMGERVARTAFLAETELRVIATDVAVPEEIVYNNHDPRLSDPDNPEHCERFIDGIRGSAGLPGRFNLDPVAGRIPRDGEVWSDFPIEHFEGEVDIVFRLDYWAPLQPSLPPKSWLPDLFRSFDVMRDGETTQKMNRYELAREKNPALPRVVCIRASEATLRRIPELAVYEFAPGQLWRSMKLGRAIFRENLPLIRRELGLE